MADSDPSETELVLISQERCDHCAELRSKVKKSDIWAGPYGRSEPYIVELPKDWTNDSFPPQIDREPKVRGHKKVEEFIERYNK